MKSFAVLSLCVLGLCIKRSSALPYSEFHRNGIRAALTVSTDATCGGDSGHTCLNSAFGNCCSSSGYCGSTSAYCGTGCQTKFGSCTSAGSSGTSPSSKAAAPVASSKPSAAAPSAPVVSKAAKAIASIIPSAVPSAINKGASAVASYAIQVMPSVMLPPIPSKSAAAAPAASSASSAVSGAYPCGQVVGCSTGQDFISQSLTATKASECQALCKTAKCTFFSFGERTDGQKGSFCNLYSGTFANDYRMGTSGKVGCTTSKWYDAKCKL